MVFALLAFGGSITFLVKHAADSDSEHQYLAAQPCLSAVLANGQCYEVISATVLSKSGGGPNNYNLDLTVPGLGRTSEGLAGGDRAAIYGRLTVGGPVSVKVWRHQVTLVLLGDLRAATFRNPTYATGDDIPAAVTFAILGVLLTGQGFVTFRSKPRDWVAVPDPELDSLSGPFGMDAGTSIEVTRHYRLPLGAARTTSMALLLILVSLGTAIRISASSTSLLVGAVVGIVLSATTLWITRGSSVSVGPPGITLHRPWGHTTTAWSDVISAGFARRGYVVKSRTEGFAGGSTRTLNLSPFLQNRANASLPRLVALYLARRTPDPVATNPAPGPAAASASSNQQMVRAGIGARLAAWAVDVVTAVVLWFIAAVTIELILSIPYGGRIPDSLGSATVFLAVVVTVPTYAILCWRVGRTLGLRLLGLYVVDAGSGGRLSWGQCLVRFAGAVPSIVLAIPFGLFMAAGADRLALHDRFAHSAVVPRGSTRQRTVVAEATDQHAP